MADDARAKLEAALANAKARQAKGGAPAPSPPSRSAPARSTSSAAPAKPAPKPKKKKAPKKKKPPKKKGPGLGNVLGKKFSSFASTVVDELKTATAEITPGALLASANDSIQSLKKAVGMEEEGQAASQDQSADKSEVPASQNGGAANIERATSSLPLEPDVDSIPQPAQNAAPEAPAEMTSPAKVIKMPSKKKKAPPTGDASAPAAPAEQGASTESGAPTEQPAEGQAPPDESAAPSSAPLPPAEAPTGAQEITDGPAGMTSPAQIQRAPAKKNSSATSESETDAPDGTSEDAPESAGDASPDESASGDPESEGQTGSASDESPGLDDAEEKTTTKAPPKPVVVSKTEHSVRSFRALQTMLTNPVWAPIVTDPAAKPSSLFAPREHFDVQFSDPVFRDGLKAASRLATTYAFEPEKMKFNPKIIERVLAIELDPEGQIKPHTENITSVMDEDTITKVLDMLDNGHVKHLLFSVGTRLGTFVPTIESLARIYLTLRKKTELSSGDRLQIQEEILMRYKKAAYTDEMGKKARNLALNYFLDYVVEYAMKLFKDRFENSPEGQDNAESHFRRYNTITSFCRGTIEDWCTKIALSAQVIENVVEKFEEQASELFRERVGEPPPPDV